MSKILVTGGAGFIGSTLVDSLIREGHQLVVLDNLVSGKKEYINSAAKFYEVSICDPEVKGIFLSEKPDIVYHLAAQIDVRISLKDPVLDNNINAVGSLNILENCRLSNVKKFIFVSTGGAIYGESEEIPTTEKAATYPLSPYGIHKLTAEKYCKYYNELYGLDYTILRFANVYGPRQYKGGEAGVVAIFIEHVVTAKTCYINGDGLQTRDYVYVDDVVSALSKTKDISYQGEVNISCAKEVSVLEIVSAIKTSLGADFFPEHRPEIVGEQRRSCLSYDLAKNILGWEPQIDINEGVRRTLKWTKTLNI